MLSLFYFTSVSIFVLTDSSFSWKTSASLNNTFLMKHVVTTSNSQTKCRDDIQASNPMAKYFHTLRSKRNLESTARISAIKCKEYSERTSKTVWIMKSSPIEVRLKCRRLANPLIVGGDLARADEFPHMVALGVRLNSSRSEYFCAGSLISERWILTVAHCTGGERGPPTLALLGSTGLHELDAESGGTKAEIAETRIHPDYRPPRLYADLALLGLAVPATFGPSIKPACLYSGGPEPRRLWASGWAGTSGAPSKARLQVIETEACARIYEDELRLPRGIDSRTQVCAGDPKGGWRRDTCAGDSGVPLQARHPLGCLYELVALTSFGISCGMPEVPGVYTRILHYVDWIESVVWPQEQPRFNFD